MLNAARVGKGRSELEVADIAALAVEITALTLMDYRASNAWFIWRARLTSPLCR
jgi:hypothetical protein